MTGFIPYGRQSVTQDDIDAVTEVLKSDFLTLGPVVPAFEDTVANRVGAQHAVAANSATSALHIACMALGIGPGDEVWTSPLTFVASSNAALYCGASVDFVDVDPRTYNMCPDALAVKLEAAALAGNLPKAIIPVHLTGQSCDMAAILAAASKHGVKIIEDASHAIGGSYQGKPVGNCRYSDIAIFSFHPVKIVTTGEGGMALTNDAGLAQRMRMGRSHGITRDPDLLERQDEGAWYYEQHSLGYNYRMTDINAALGLSQLDRLDVFIDRRREVAATYDAAFSEMAATIPWQLPDAQSAWHLYVLQVAAEKHGSIFDALRAAQIGVNLHYIPVYLQPYYQRLGFKAGHCPNAESYYASAISLPMFPTITDEQQARVVEEVAKVLSQ